MVSIPTVEESVRAKIAGVAKWKKENPGLEWVNPGSPQNEPKIYITRSVLFSDALWTLGRAAILVYLVFLSKREMIFTGRSPKKKWVCVNNGEIVFPYSEAENDYKIGRKTFRNAIDELQLKGFIDLTHQGKGGRPPINGGGDMSTYWIDDRWEEYGTDDFRPPRNPRVKDTRQDRGWYLYNKTQREKNRLKEKFPVYEWEPVFPETSGKKGTGFLKYLKWSQLYLTDFTRPHETAWLEN